MPHDLPTAGTQHFLTLRLADRSGDLLLRRISCLRRAMRAVMDRHPLRIDAIAVLPATLHTLWSLPPGDTNTSCRVARLKSRFSRAMPMPAHRSLAQIQRGEKGIWQRSHWEHQIADNADFERHKGLIYLSPVHANLCKRPQDWIHTSLHRDLRIGTVAQTARPAPDQNTKSPAHPPKDAPADPTSPAYAN